MTDIRERLQAMLADRYRFERELGGGGMSRVFLATELRLDRPVVIKVLPAATSAALEGDRFEREIMVAASLHHPHIVQLLATGDADGVLWYAMPFVEGESLSERLQRGPLPPLEVVRLLREVADALAYAHARGIVHRDIKPANIMLSGRHAMVTDFGVAKALAAGGRVENETGERTAAAALTSVGMALGTPAYMAPEQAVADPNVDHRADIYSLGIVAYEMLTGASPYRADTPQAMLAAHVTQPAQPINAQRTDIPIDLANVVMRCLAKAPADRFASASDLVDALEVVGTPSGGSTPFDAKARAQSIFRKWHPGRVVVLQVLATCCITAIAFGLTRVAGLPDWIWWAVALVMLLGIPPLVIASRNERRRAHATMTGMHAAVRQGELTGQKAIRGGLVATGAVAIVAALLVVAGVLGIGPGATLMSRGRIGTNAGLVLADFSVTGSDSSIGGAVLEALRVDLSQSSAIHLLQPTEISDALQRMGQASSVRLTDSVAREVAQRSNAKATVTGDVRQLGAGFVLTANVIEAGSGQVLASVRETAASDKELIPAVNRLSKSLRQKIGESLKSIRASESLEQVTTASLPALRLYSQADKVFESNDLDAARRLLQQALAIDSSFAMAWRKLAVVATNSGMADLAVNAARKAVTFHDHLPPLERALTDGSFRSQTNDYAGAYAAFQQALQIDPTSAPALNNSALALNVLGRFAEAEASARRCIAAWPTTFTCYNNLEGALAGQLKRSTDDSLPLIWVRNGGDTLRARGLRVIVASSWRDDAAIDSVVPGVLRSLPVGDPRHRNMLSMLTISLGRRGQWQRANQRVQEIATDLDQGGVGGGALAVDLTHAFYAAIVQGDADGAWRLLERGLVEHPIDSMRPGDRPYSDVAEIAAFAGRVQDVKRLRTAWEATVVPSERQRWMVAGWDGLDAFARQDWRGSADAIGRAFSTAHCWPCGAYEFAYALDRAGLHDSAAAIYRRAVDEPLTDVNAGYGEATWYPVALQKVGEYYAQKNDRKNAVEYLGRFIHTWSNADPELQPKVKQARDRMAELAGEKPRP